MLVGIEGSVRKSMHPYTRVRRPVGSYNYCFHLIFEVSTSCILNIMAWGYHWTWVGFFWGYRVYFLEYLNQRRS